MVEIIIAAVAAVSSVAVAAFKFLTVRELAKRAAQKDIPTIARHVYQPRAVDRSLSRKQVPEAPAGEGV